MDINTKFCLPSPVVKMLLMLIIALIMVCLSDIAFAGEWTKKGDTKIPKTNVQFTAQVFNNEIYTISGCDGGMGQGQVDDTMNEFV